MAEYLYVIIRTLLILLFLLLVARILGRRTLSELTFYDFVIGLVIGHIGGAVITVLEFTIWHGVTALITMTLWVLALNTLALKSIPARKLIEAEPLMVIHHGKILEDNLKKRYYNVNDLLEMLREQGNFDPNQIEVALLEPDGQLSVMKKQEYQNVAAKDLNIASPNQTPASIFAGKELVIDGTIIHQNLQESGLTAEQLKGQLNNLGIIKLEEVMLAIITPEGKLYVDKRKD